MGGWIGSFLSVVRCCGMCPRVRGLSLQYLFIFLPLYRPRAGIVQRTTSVLLILDSTTRTAAVLLKVNNACFLLNTTWYYFLRVHYKAAHAPCFLQQKHTCSSPTSEDMLGISTSQPFSARNVRRGSYFWGNPPELLCFLCVL